MKKKFRIFAEKATFEDAKKGMIFKSF